MVSLPEVFLASAVNLNSTTEFVSNLDNVSCSSTTTPSWEAIFPPPTCVSSTDLWFLSFFISTPFNRDLHDAQIINDNEADDDLADEPNQFADFKLNAECSQHL
ncbi:hypothetical protein PCASD_13092 [Puccinia coronata f. sp. avenae]|uniref:Uncharacterized protein n=1 Tax=Puccinia coronata f. sp. avenae TaxID=200324 RepID=A0A2N5U8M3_9BASI|nr:hypothetical protein PCASD_13092 [Puccinia coronata f. sp. avenae]